MLIDSATISDKSVMNADLCIIGAGGAGLSLSYALRHTPISIIILDSGDMENDELKRGFLRGKNTGKHGFNLAGQRRRIGGGTNDWSGNCSLLEPCDFTCEDVDKPHWPFGFETLSKYAGQVESYLGLDQNFEAGTLAQTSEESNVPWESETDLNRSTDLKQKRFIRSKMTLPSTHFEEITSQSHDLRIISGLTVGKLTFNNDENSIKQVDAITTDNKTITICSKIIVLASGLENAPILMRTFEGNEKSPKPHLPALGRYLHSHLLTLKGFFIPCERSADRFKTWCLPGDLGPIGKAESKSFSGLQVSSALRKQHQLLNTAMFLSPVTSEALLVPKEVTPIAQDLLEKHAGKTKEWPIFAIRHYMEQAPNWDSRVTLGETHGNSPFKRPCYNWKVNDEEIRTIEQNLTYLEQHMSRNKLGEVFPVSCGEELNPKILSNNAHPMGGTIMGNSREKSVVDSNCRVHGIENLYIIGGSVLPKSGAGMLTGVILQLTFRLAEHLKNQYIDIVK